MSEKVQFVLSDDAMQVINTNATERKRGEWLSRLVTEYSSLLHGPAENQQVGLLERIDNRLARIEKQLAVLIAKA